MSKMTNNRAPWTSEDIENLKALLASGASPAELAKRLGRTREAISTKARRVAADSR